jgi:DNA-binding CsgD family transcriptional regulator
MADTWAWSLACRIEPGQPQTYAGIMHGGWDEGRLAKFMLAVEHPVMAKATERFFLEVASAGGQVTMLRSEIDPDGLSSEGEVAKCWEAADIGPVIMSTYSLEDGSQSGIGFYRSFGAEAFGDREKSIVHMVLEEVRWLHLTGWPEDRGATVPQLYPRQRIILNLLLDGISRKQIAAQLEISENTVSSYIKEVYQHFGVHSHVELMRKFLVAS